MSMVEFVQAYIDANGAVGLIVIAAAKATVILVLALAVNAVLRSASASTRHLVWSVAIGAVLLVPALTALVPRWDLPFTLQVEPREHQPELVGLPVMEAADPVVWSGGEMSINVGSSVVEPDPVGVVSEAPVVSSGVAWSEAEVVGAGTAYAGPETVWRAADVSWATWMVAAWMTGTLITLGAILLGLARTWLMRRNAVRLTTGSLVDELDELWLRAGLNRHVTLLQCRGRCVPMTWGFFNAVILVPADAEEWPEERRRSVLLHELAHIKRNDYATQLMARLVCALHWFNPLAWLAARRLRVEREMACDDQVLLLGSRASDYAGHLLDVARSLKAEPLAAMATVAMARPSQLGERLRAVLEEGRERRTVTPRGALAVCAAALLITLPIAAATPSRAEIAAAPDESGETSATAVAGAVEWRSSDSRSEVGPVDNIPEAPGELRIPSSVAGLPSSGETWPSVGVERPSLATPRVGPETVVRSGFYGGQSTAALCDWYATGNMSSSTNVNNEEWRVKMSRDDCELSVTLDGELTFNADETDIVSLTRGGRLEIEEKRGRRARKLRLETDRDGSLERSWWMDGDESDFDADARAWQADMILVLFRRVGYQATERAERILARDGTDALLQEISYIPSDWTAQKYYTVLLAKGDLDSDELAAALRQAGRDIESDHNLSRLLISVGENRTLDETVMAAYIDAASSIESDHQTGAVLVALLDNQQLSDDLVSSVVVASSGIESDHQTARVLTGVAERYPIEGSVATAYVETAGTISSNHQLQQVLLAVMKSGALSPATQNQLLDAAANIESDHQLKSLLTEFVRIYGITDMTRESFFRACDALDSDTQKSDVLSAVIDDGTASDATMAAVLSSSRTIDSDRQLSSLLVEIAGKYTLSEDLQADFMRVTDSISSDRERNRVLSAMYPRSSGGRRF
jgi:beta-lactamase regulating signal transducer with metallopeptidase domain